jgi:hypothetical protein
MTNDFFHPNFAILHPREAMDAKEKVACFRQIIVTVPQESEGTVKNFSHYGGLHFIERLKKTDTHYITIINIP